MSKVEPLPELNKQLAAVLALFVVAFSSLAAYDVWANQTSFNGTTTTLTCNPDTNHCNLNVPLSVSLALNVTVTDHGKLVANRYLPHDLILNNFYNWLIQFLNNAQSGSAATATIKDTSASSQSLGVWGTAQAAGCGSNGGYAWSCALAGQGGLIEVGTLSTAAARTDTNLGSLFQGYFDTSTTCSTGSTDSTVVTGSENANTGATITEAGLFVQSSGFNGAVHTFMFAHDVFAGVSVSAGNTITIQYTWSLNNGGFNYNLCEYLAAVFTQPNGASNNVRTPNALMVFFDTSGRNVSWAPYCNSFTSATAPFGPLSSSQPTSANCAGWASGDGTNTVTIHVGTGAVAYTPTTRSLTTDYANNFITNTNYDNAGNAYQTANVLLSTGTTISEAAIYFTMPKGCVGYSPSGTGSCKTGYQSDTIMLLGTTFTGVVVPNGASIGITFQESG